MDELLKFAFRIADVRPEFTKSRCLAVRQSPGACKRCADVCPHDAVTVRSKGVEINDVDCSGCGLCVQACPSGALEPKLRISAGHPAKCSQVSGDAQTVHCLGRLQPTDLHKLLRGRSKLLLAHGDCANCEIGGAAVQDAIEKVAQEARELLMLRGSESEIIVEQRERLDDEEVAEVLDRRALLRGGWRNMAEGASTLLAPLDRDGPEGELPRESARLWRAFEVSQLEDETNVPWPLPVVDDSCIMCPICTRVCPTEAFSRTYDDDGGAALVLNPSRCIGCDACVGACPVDAIEMNPTPTWAEANTGPREVFRREGRSTDGGTVARSDAGV